MPKAQILIAQDDTNLSAILKTRLSVLGYDVLTVDNGEEAENMMVSSAPDLCILDIMMHKRNGIEVSENKIKNPDIADIPVLIISNLSQQKDIDTALALGAKDYLVKGNVSLAQIVGKVDQLLRGSPPRHRAENAAPLLKAVSQPQTPPEEQTQAAVSLPVSPPAAPPASPYPIVYMPPADGRPEMYYYLVPATTTPPVSPNG